MRDEIENTYATKDLYLSAFLEVKGMAVVKLEQFGGGRNPVYFIFSNQVRCEELEGVFWSGKGIDAVINVRDYCTALRSLRSRLSSVTRMADSLDNH